MQRDSNYLLTTNYNNIDLNASGIAVICNAWAELDQEIHKKSFDATIRCINFYPGIHSVLLAATHVGLNKENQGINLWYDNSRMIFVDEQGVDWIRRLWLAAADNKIDLNRSLFHHNPSIRDHNYQGKFCMGIWEQWQLEWLLNHYFPQVKNVWYFGAGLGVRRDPFGWAQLCDLIRYQHTRPLNILSHRFGMLNNRQDSQNLNQANFEYIEWELLSDWHLVTQDIFVKTNLEW